MTHVIQLSIPIYESMLCLAYSGPCDRLLQEFPAAILDDDWSEIGEYQALVDHLQTSDVSEKNREKMKAQIRAKQICHGPTIRFRLPGDHGTSEITGAIFRWGITFRSGEPFSETMRTTIEAFLKSFTIGTVESYSH